MADVNGFFSPNDLGFNIPDPNLLMRLFPVKESNDARGVARVPDAVSLFQYMGIPNSHDIFGENMRQMPGVIWSCSLGGPSVGDLNMLDEAILNADLGGDFAGVGGTVYGWLRKYAISQICNVAAHVYYYKSDNNWGGLNFFMDITEHTLLTKVFNVHFVLSVLRGSTPNYSLIEYPENELAVRSCIGEAMAWAILRVPEDVTLPLWKILSIAIYALFRRIKNGGNGFDWREPIVDDPYDYNLRIYLVKRTGKFNGGGLPNTVWIAMAQYYRFFTVFQRPFQIDYGAGPRDMSVVKRFVTRDAHASTSSSYSAVFDEIFFNNAAASGMRTIMLGINPEYKLKRHAKLADLRDTWVIPFNDARFSRNSFGVLAGVCWFYNPENTFLCNPDIYTIFLLPFDNLELYNGVWVPESFKQIDRADVLQQMPTFFMYGLDEYILSEFVNQHFNSEAKWNEINLLFFSIHWIHDIIRDGNNNGEYYPLLKYGLALTRPPWPDMTPLNQHLFTLANGNDFSLAAYFNTFFGNVNNNDIRVTPANAIINAPNLPEYIARKDIFRDKFRGCIDIWNNDLNVPCVLDHCHRFDRPLYWKGGQYGDGQWYSPSQRIIRDRRSIPNSRKVNIADATQAIIPRAELGMMNPTDRVDVPEDPPDKFCPAGPNIILGGKRKKIRKTRKHKKTRKHYKKQTKKVL